MREEDNLNKYIPLNEATRFCNYSQEYLSLRARQGKLKAIKFGRNWVTKQDWLEEYLGQVENYNNGNGHENSANKKLGVVPDNLPIELASWQKIKFPSLPKLDFPRLNLPVRGARVGFLVALAFSLLLNNIAFGKENLKNVFNDADALAKNLGDGADRMVRESGQGLASVYEDISDSTLSLGSLADRLLVDSGKSFANVFYDIDDFTTGLGDQTERSLAESDQSLENVFQDASLYTYILGNKADGFLADSAMSFATIFGDFQNISLGLAKAEEAGGSNLKNYFSWLGQKYKDTNAALEEGLKNSVERVKDGYWAANFQVEQKLKEAGQKITQPFVKFFKFAASPWQQGLLERVWEEEYATKEEYEALEEEVSVLKEKGLVAKEITKEVSRITQVEPVKEITKEVMRVDETALRQVRASIVELQDAVAKRLYAPGGVISQQIYITQPVSSPKVYQENGDIVFQTVGTGNVIMSAATGMQISGNQVTIDSTSAANPLVYIADKTQINGNTSIGGTLTTHQVTINTDSSFTDKILDVKSGADSKFSVTSAAATLVGNFTMTGNMTVNGNQTFSGALTLSTSTDSAVLTVAQSGSGKIFDFSSTGSGVTSDLGLISGSTSGAVLALFQSGSGMALSATGSISFTETAFGISSKVADDILFATYFNEGSLQGSRGQLPTYSDATDNIPTFQLVQDSQDRAPGGRALVFSSSTDVEILTYPTANNILSATGSISLWYSPSFAYDATDTQVYLFETANHLRLYYDGSDDKFHFSAFNGNNWASSTVASASQTFAANNWISLVATWDNDAATALKLYANSIEASSTATWTAQATPTNMYLGSNATTSPTLQAWGKITDFVIYNRALTQQEVKQLYNLKQPVADYAHTTTRYARVLTVGKWGADYTSLSLALNAITDNSSSQLYLIRVMPGIYSEAVAMKQYVDIISEAGPGNTIIRQSTATTVSATSSARLEGFTVDKTTDDTSAIIEVGASSPTLENLIITGGGQSTTTAVNITTGSPRLNNVRISNANTGIKVTTGSPILTNLKIGDPTQAVIGLNHSGTSGTTTLNFSTILASTTDLYISGNGGQVNSANNIFQSLNKNLEIDTGGLIESVSDRYVSVDNDGTFRDFSQTRQYTCSATEAVGNVVYVSGTDTVAQAAASSTASMPAVGMVVKKPSSTSCVVKTAGVYYQNGAGWTVGSTYYVSASAAGGITTTKPAGEIAQVAGIAKSGEELVLSYDLSTNIETASYQNVLTVSPDGGDYSTIQSAVDAISNATSTNRYLILVYPAVYSEALTLNNKWFIDIVGVGGSEVTKVSTTSAVALTVSGNTSNVLIKGLNFDVSADARNGGAVISLGSTGSNVTLKNLTLTSATTTGGDNSIGLAITSTGGSLLNDLKITGALTSLKQTGSASTTLAYSDLTSSAGGKDIDLDAGSIDSSFNTLRGATNIDIAASTVFNSFKDTYSKVTNAGSFNQKDYSRNDSVTALTVTQSGSGNIFDLYDGSNIAFTVKDGGSVGIATSTPRDTLEVWGGMYVGTSLAPTFYVASSTGRVAVGTSSPATLFSVATSTNILNVLTNGKIGIGTSTPPVALAIDASDAVLLPAGTDAQRPTGIRGLIRFNTTVSTFEGNDGSNWTGLGGVIDVDRDTKILAELTSGSDDDALFFYTGDSERMRINSSGNLGIGTTTPTEMLSVRGGLFVGTSTVGVPTLYVASSTGRVGVGTSSPATLFSIATSTNIFNVTAGGRVGIGTTTPTEALEINGNLKFSGNATLTAGASGNLVFDAGGGSITMASGDDLLAAGANSDIGSAGTRFAVIYADEVNAGSLIGTSTTGNISAQTLTINSDNTSGDLEDSYLAFERGSATPNALLQWNSTSTLFDMNFGLRITNSTGTNSFVVFDQDSDSTPFVIDQSGNVVIGSSTAATLFTVATSSPIFNVLNSGFVGIGTTSPAYTLSVTGNIYGSGNAIFGGTLSAATTTITGNLIPSSDAAYLLGSSTARWANLYTATATIGGTITINSTDVTGSSALNLTGAAASTWKTSSGALTIQSADSLTATSTGAMVFGTGGSERMRIDSAGNVGIGTTSPASLLEIYSATNTNTQLTITAATSSTYDSLIAFRTGYAAPTTKFNLGVDQSSGNNFVIATSTLGTNNLLGINFASTSVSIATNTYAGVFNIATSSPMLTVLPNGYVGIGTTAPEQSLETGGAIRVIDYNYLSRLPSEGDAVFGFNALMTTDAANLKTGSIDASSIHPQAILMGPGQGIRFITRNDWPGVSTDFTIATYERMRLTPIGRLGIWDTDPDFGLELATSSGSGYFAVSSAAGNDGNVFIIDTNGNVGIGTTTPTEMLSVRGGLFVGTSTVGVPTLYVASSTGRVGVGTSSPATLFTIATSTNIFNVTTAGGVGIATSSPTGLLTVGSTSPALVVLQNGNVGIGTTGPLSTFEVAASKTINFNSSPVSNLTLGTALTGAGNNLNGIGDIQFTNNNSIKSAESDGQYVLFQGQDTGVGLVEVARIQGAADPYFRAGNLYAMYSEKVGIATSSPSEVLTVRATSTTAGLGVYASNSTPIIYTNLAGNVGIGTTTPATLFTVATTTNIFNVLTNGNVGIGTASPLYALDINGSSALWQSVYGTDDGLVGYWPFSEATGTKAYDLGAYGNDGTTTAGNGGWTTGKYGNAYNFDGGTTSVQVATTPSLSNFTAMTIEFWVSTAQKAGASWTHILDAGRWASPFGYAAQIDDSTRVINLILRNTAGTSQNVNVNFTDNSWLHVVMAWDGTTMTPYANGVPGTTAALSGTIAPTADLYFGRRSDSAANYWNGKLDEVRIYNRALSADEIKTHYLRGRESGRLAVIGYSASSSNAYGLRGVVTDTGIVTTGTDNNYGLKLDVSRTGATGGTINTYGQYVNVVSDNAGSGTHNAYGTYVNLDGNADNNYAGIFLGGRVGVATSSPSEMLTIKASTTNAAFGVYASNSTPIIYTNLAGNVGIGTTTPSQAFEVYNGNIMLSGTGGSGGVGTSAIFFGSTGSRSGRDTNGAPIYSDDGGLSFVIDANNNQNNVSFVVAHDSATVSGATELFRIQETGEAALGTTSPASLFEIYTSTSSNAQLTITAATSSTYDSLIAFRTGAFSPTTRFNLGVDQSSNNNFVISTTTLGTADIFSINYASTSVSIGTSTFTGLFNIATSSPMLTVLPSGNVGIGTAAPLTNLHVNLGTDQNIGFSSISSTARISAFNDGAGAQVPLRLEATEFEIMNGNVGIGTTTPTEMLSVRGGLFVGTSTIGVPTLYVASSTGRVGVGTSSPATLFSIATSTNIFNVTTAGGVGIATSSPTGLLTVGSSTPALVVLQNGNVGIGTASPASTLEIGSGQLLLPAGSSGAPAIAFKDSTDMGLFRNSSTQLGISIGGVKLLYSANTFAFQEATTISTPVNTNLTLSNSGTGNINLTPGNNVGIGTTTPTETLTVSGGLFVGTSTVGVPTLYVASSTGRVGVGTSSPATLFTVATSSNILNVTTAGYVGIGTSTPIAQLHVAGMVPTGSVGSTTTGVQPYYIYVQGRYAYVVNYGSSTLQVFDVSNSSSPTVVGSTSVGVGVRPVSVYVQGQYAYVGNSTATQNFTVVNVSNPADPSVTASTTVSDVVGVTSVYVQGRYAYLNTSNNNGFQVWDISNPANPQKASSVNSGFDAYSTYVQGRYAYVVSRSLGALEIYDISNPSSIATTTTIGISSAGQPRGIYVQGRYAYIAMGNTGWFAIYDISNPASPSVVSSTTANAAYGIFVQGRYAYLASYGANKIQIFDVSNPSAPVSVGTANTDTNPISLFAQGRYLYSVNYTANSLQVFDLGGGYIQQLETGGIETGTLSTRNNLAVGNDLDIRGAVYAARGAEIMGPLGVYGGAASSTFVVDRSGNVGIGTSSPNNILQIRSAGGFIVTSDIRAAGSGGTGLVAYQSALPTVADQRLGFFFAGSDSGNTARNNVGLAGNSSAAWTDGSSYPTYLSFYTTPSGSTERYEVMRLDSAGKMGVGTTSPAEMLTVKATSTSAGLGVYASNSTPIIYTNLAGNVGIGTSSPATLFTVATTTNIFNITTAGGVGIATSSPTGLLTVGSTSPALVVLQSGNVGIGTAAPNVKLAFESAEGEKIALYDNTNASNRFGLGIATNNYQFYVDTGAFFSWNTGGFQSTAGTNEIMRITNGGIVGIGTTTPTETLSVRGGLFVGTSTIGVPTLYVASSTGRVGVGTSSPSTLFAVATSSNIFTVNAAGNATLLGDLTVSGGDIGGSLSSLTLANAGWVGLGGSAGRIVFTDTATDAITFQNSNVGIGVSAPEAKLQVAGDLIASGVGPSAENNVINGGFEQGGAGWTFDRGATTSSSSVAHAGNNYYQVAANGATEDAVYSNKWEVRPGDIYYVNFWYKTDSTADGTSNYRLRFLDKDNAYVYSEPISISTTTAWTQASTTVTVPADAHFVQFNIYKAAAGTTGNWYFDDIYVHKANYPGPLYVGTGGGKSGFGTTSPSETLTIRATSSAAAFGVYASNSSPIIYANRAGNVGVGTSSPATLFTVATSSNIFNITTAGGVGIATSSPTGLLTIGSTSPALVVLQSGNVGIGTASPDQLLDVRKDQNAVTYLHLENQTAGTAAKAVLLLEAAGLSGQIGVNNSSFTASGNLVADQMFIQSASTASGGLLIESLAGNVNIMSAGLVGIGTTTPTEMLTVSGGLFVGTSTIGVPTLYVASSTGRVGVGTSSPATLFSIATSTNIFNITTAGGVGIATSSPTGLLTVGSSTPALVVLQNGNVGIGTAAPGTALDVRNAISVGTAGTTEGLITFQTTGGGETAPTIDASAGSLRLTPSTGWVELNPSNGVRMVGGTDLWWTANSGNANFDFYNAANTAVTIKNTGGGVANLIVATGLVGISTTSPTEMLTIRATSTTAGLGVYASNSTPIIYTSLAGNVGIGTTTPTALLHLKAGTATTSTSPLKFTSGALLTTPEMGAVEFLTDEWYGSFAYSQDEEVISNHLSYTLASGRSITVGKNIQSVSISFDMRQAGTVTAYGRIYKNGVAAGTERSTSDTSYTTYTETFTNLFEGDVISLWTYHTGGGGQEFTRNFRVGSSIRNTFAYLESPNFSGNVGIGTTSPSEVLTIKATSTYAALGVYASNSTPIIYTNLAGNVGIGTSSPATLFTVATTTNIFNVTTAGGVGIATSSPTGLLTVGSTSPALVVLQSGNVGIGTAAPTVALDVKGKDTDNTVLAQFYSNQGTRGEFVIKNGVGTSPTMYIGNNGNNEALAIGSGNALEVIRLTSTGLMGVGSSSPSEVLTIKATSTTAGLGVYASNSTPIIYTSLAGTVGIGMTAPVYRLDVKGTVNTSANLLRLLDSDSSSMFEFKQDPSGNALVYIRDTNEVAQVSFAAGGTSWILGGNFGLATSSPGQVLTVVASTTNGAFGAYASNSTPIIYTSLAGYVGIGTTAPVYPLHVYGTGTNIVKIQTTGASDAGLYIDGNTSNSGVPGLVLQDGSTDKAYVLLERTSSPRMTNASRNDLIIYTESTNNIVFGTNNTEKMRIASGGNVGIGTTTPTAWLQVYGSSATTSLSVIQKGSGNIVDFASNTTSVFTLKSSDQLEYRDGLTTTWGDFNDVVLDDFENNIVTDWYSSDVTNSTTTSSATTSQYKVGDYSLALTTVVGSSFADQATTSPSTTDWSSYERLGFWLMAKYNSTSSSATTSDILAFRWKDSGGTTTHSTTTIKEFGRWQYTEVDLTQAASTDRDVVSWYGFNIQNDYGSPIFYIDQVRLYDSDERTSEVFVDKNGNLNLVSSSKIELTRTTPGGNTLPGLSIDSAVVQLNQPLSVNVGGDVGLDYDLYFANTGLAQITSEGPLKISAGDGNHYENLTLGVGGTGDIIMDIASSTLGYKITGPSTSTFGGYVFRVAPSGQTSIAATTSIIGYLGVGTTTPSTLFAVATSTNIFNVLTNGNVGVGTSSPSGVFVVGTTSASLFVNQAGNVGIGTTTPGSNLDVVGANADSQIYFQAHGGAPEVFRIARDTNTYMALRDTTGATKFFIDADGDSYLNNSNKLGISTTSPTEMLTVRATSTTAAFGVYASNSTPIIYTSLAGNVGIGTTTPTFDLELAKSKSGGAVVARIANTSNTSGSSARFALSVAGSSAGNPNIYWDISGAQDYIMGVDNSDSDKFKIVPGPTIGVASGLTITTAGLVGVGTTTPSEMLTIRATSTNPGLGVYASNSTPIIYTNLAGLVGIGTTGPNAPLHIYQSGTAITFGADGGSAAAIVEGAYQSNGSLGNLQIFSNDAQAVDKGGSIILGGKYTSNENVAAFAKILAGKDNSTSGQYGGYLALYTRTDGVPTAERLRISSSGLVGIATTTPTAWLQVYGSVATTSLSVIQTGSGNIVDFASNTTSIFTLKSSDQLEYRDGLTTTWGDFNDVVLDDFENNIVTDWATSSGSIATTTASATTTQVKVGDYSLAFISSNTTVGDAAGDIASTTPVTTNWSGYERLGYWIMARYNSTSSSATNSEVVSFVFRDTTQSGASGTSTYATTTIKEFGRWQYTEIDLTAFPSGDLDSVRWYGFAVNNDYGSPIFYIDQVRLYDSDERTSEVFVDLNGRLNLTSPNAIELTRTSPGTDQLPSLSIGSAVVEFNQPIAVNTGGDVGIGADLQFLNTGSSYITSAGPLWIMAGDQNKTQNLVLTVAGESGKDSGDVIVDVRYSNTAYGGFKVIGSDSGNYVFRVSPSGDVEVGGSGSGGSDLTVKQNMALAGGNLTIGQLATPTNLTYNSTTTGGSCVQSTWYYRVSAANDNGETLATASTTATVTGGAGTVTVNVSWDPVSGATKYYLYATTTAGTGAMNNGSTTNSFAINAPNTTYADTCTGYTLRAIPSYNTTGGKLTASGDALPSAHNLYDLGTTTLKWKSISAVSNNIGDLIFANQFVITEASTLGINPPEALVFQNASGTILMSLDEDGKLVVSEKIETKVAKVEKLEMVDQNATSTVWCVWIAAGQWYRSEGECTATSTDNGQQFGNSTSSNATSSEATTTPETIIDSASPASGEATTSVGALFAFHAEQNGTTTAGATFQCKLGVLDWASCESPKTYSGLTVGDYTFQVYATDPQGSYDASPASSTWSIIEELGPQ